MTASLLCAVHCLLLPIALSFLSIASFGSFGSDGGAWVHRIFAGTAILAASFGLRGGYRRHRNRTVMILGTIGSVLLLSASLIPSTILSEASERGVTLLGAALLSTAHSRNWSLLKAGYHCAESLKSIPASTPDGREAKSL